MSIVVDLELKRAFGELQQKMLDTTQKLKIADLQIETLKRSKQRAELTSQEVKELPPRTKSYESIGRMFMLASSETVLKNLTNEVNLCDEKITALEGNKRYLESSLKDSENNLREMVQQKKEKHDK